MKRQHKTLRVPDNWRGQDRSFVMQLEQILDDIYNNLNSVKSVLGIKPDDNGNVALTKESLIGLVPEIVDNLSDESSDKALSARQGKILSDAVTVEEVESPVTWDTTYVVPSSCTALLYKIGNIHILQVGVYVRNNITSTTVLGVVKQGHRPPGTMLVVVSTSGTSPVSKTLALLSNGNLRTVSMNASTGAGNMYYGEIIYVADNQTNALMLGAQNDLNSVSQQDGI